MEQENRGIPPAEQGGQGEGLFYPDEPPTGQWMIEDINQLLLWMGERAASDAFIRAGVPISFKVHGDTVPVCRKPLKLETVSALLDWMLNDPSASASVRGGTPLDFGYEVKADRFTKRRFRGNASAVPCGWSTGIDITLRSIPSIPPPLEEFDLEPEILDACFPYKGLVLVTGVMGSGKSTLLGAILREIIETQPRRLLTYEAPIEFDLMSIPNPKTFVSQMEIPKHLAEFSLAPRNAARRSADYILVGEARDEVTLRGMIEAAEIGVTAYATVHTESVAGTPSRIISGFPDELQNHVSAVLLSSLRLVIQQRLVPKIGGGRVALREFLVFTPDLRTGLLSVPLPKLIPTLHDLVRQHGQTLEQDARRKFDNGVIAEDVYRVIAREQGETSGMA